MSFLEFFFSLPNLTNRRSPTYIGEIAELQVSSHLLKLPNAVYKVINNLMIPSHGKTKYTQIDHVVVSNYGIFCIETKANKGWIYGNSKQDKWVQIIYKYRNSFYNPMRQNYAHTQALELALRSQLKSPIIPYVVFPNANKIVGTDPSQAGNIKQLLDTMLKFKQYIYTFEQRDNIYNALINLNCNNDEVRSEHIQEVRDLNNFCSY